MDGHVIFWDLKSGHTVSFYTTALSAILSIVFDTRTKTIITATAAGAIEQHSASDGHLVKVLGTHRGAVTKLRLSNDGTEMLSASTDGTARLWNLSSGMFVQLSHMEIGCGGPNRGACRQDVNRPPHFAALSRPYRHRYFGVGLTDVNWTGFEGKIATIGEDGWVKLWSNRGVLLRASNSGIRPLVEMSIDDRRAIAYIGAAGGGLAYDLHAMETTSKLDLPPHFQASALSYSLSKLKLLTRNTVAALVDTPDGRGFVGLWKLPEGSFIGGLSPSNLPITDYSISTGLANHVSFASGGLTGPGLIERKSDRPVFWQLEIADVAEETFSFDNKPWESRWHTTQIVAVTTNDHTGLTATADRSGRIAVWGRNQMFTASHTPVGRTSDDYIVDIAASAAGWVASVTQSGALFLSDPVMLRNSRLLSFQSADRMASPDPVLKIAAVDNGRSLLGGTRDGRLLLWRTDQQDASPNRPWEVGAHKLGIMSILAIGSGDRFPATSNDAVVLRELTTGLVIYSIIDNENSIVDGKANSGGTVLAVVKYLDSEKTHQIEITDTERGTVNSARLGDLSTPRVERVTDDGRAIISSGVGGTSFCLLDQTPGTMLTCTQLDEIVYSHFAVSTDSALIAVADRNSRVCRIQAASGTIISIG